jgi:plastocyanin
VALKPNRLPKLDRLTPGPLALRVVLLSMLPFVAAAPAPEQLEIVASNAGFRPRVVKLRKGESVRLLLKTADDEHCFAVDAWRIEKRIAPGRNTAVEVAPERTGEFPFYCCLEPGNDRLKGMIVVAE